MERLNEPETALLSLLKKALFNIPADVAEVDFLSLAKEAENQSVLLLALDKSGCEGVKNIEITKKLLASARKNAVVGKAHTFIDKTLKTAGIPYVILKGAASAYYYPDSSIRDMGDVDFLVYPEDLERTVGLLTGLGFKKKSDKHEYHISFEKDKVHYELHYAVTHYPNNESGELIREYFRDIIASSDYEETPMASFNMPDKFHHGLCMLMHIEGHLTSGGIGLRHLCDWAVFVNSMTEQEFLDIFKDKLKKCGLWKLAVTLSLAAEIGLGLPHRSFFGEDKVLAERILIDIVEGGNFGSKDKSRADEGRFISGATKGEGGRISSFFSLISQAVHYNFPVVKKVKILYPFFWVYIILRRIFRQITGKRGSLDLVRSFKNSKERTDLYGNLDLFIEED